MTPAEALDASQSFPTMKKSPSLRCLFFAREWTAPMPTATAVPLESLAQRIARHQAELEALRRQYEARQTHLADLKRRKEELEAQLHQLDAEIQAVNQGKTPPPQPDPTKESPAKAPTAAPPTNTPRPNTLPALLVHLVGRAKGPITVKQLAEEVEQHKFPTSSKNVARLVGTRVQGLMVRGIIKRANGQPGFVLASHQSAAQALAAKTTAAKAGTKKGTTSSKKAPSKKHGGRHEETRASSRPSCAKIVSGSLRNWPGWRNKRACRSVN